MARKRRKKKFNWLRNLALFFFTPIIVWFFAFVLWFYWYDITALFRPAEPRPKDAPFATRSVEPAARKQPEQEKILEDERKKLDQILRKR